MKNITDFDDLLKEKYGEKGTPSRDKFDADLLAFRLGVMLKEARKEAQVTQEELAERTELTDYLGGESVASDKLREEGTTNWYRPNTGATNESGFTALPGGMANNNSLMFGLGERWGGWWSATDDSGTTYALIRAMNTSVSSVINPLINKEVGLSVRCVWD